MHTPGRSSVSFLVNTDKFYSIGIQIELKKISFILIDLLGRIKKERTILNLEYNNNTFSQILSSLFNEFFNGIDKEIKDKILGIGISFPGIVDRKKLKILELANKYKFTIIEDDCMSDFYYFNNPSIPLKALDSNNNVIYINSFSKVIMPGLRIGYMVLPNKLTQEVIAAKFSSDISSSGLMQMAIYLFLKRGYLNLHIEKLRDIFKKRYEFSLSLLKNIKGLELPFLPKGGFYFWIKLPSEINSNVLYNLLKEKKVSILPSSVFFLAEEQSNNFIRLSFTSVTLEEIKDGLQILKDTISDLLEKKDFPSIL